VQMLRIRPRPALRPKIWHVQVSYQIKGCWSVFVINAAFRYNMLIRSLLEVRMTQKFEELAARFQALASQTGTSKMSSYSVTLEKPMWYEWQLALGGYDIPDWPRHVTLGPFKTLDEVLVAFEKKVIEAEAIVSARIVEEDGERKV
jgi:hypothetical protein